MPAPYPPSEFGGKIQRNNVQPPPHEPTESERLSLMYRTGDESGQSMPDGGEAFNGLVSEDEAREMYGYTD